MESRETTIDDLPADILVRILSLVPITTAIQTSALGPKWRNLWHSIPILNFNIIEFHKRFLDKSNYKVYQLFAEMVSQTLINRSRKFPLKKFLLTYCYCNYKSPRSYLNSWIRYAIDCKVKEIDIDHGVCIFPPSDVDVEDEDDDDDDDDDEDTEADERYCFDFSDLINSSVTSLKLCHCEFRLPRTCALPIKLPCLKEFHLDGYPFGIEVTDEDVSNLMSVCVNLESLGFCETWGFNGLKIVSPKLKELKLRRYSESYNFQETLEIYAPSLQSIELVSFKMGKFILGDTSSLIKARVEFDYREKLKDFARWTNVVRLLSGVETLTIQNMWRYKFEKMQEYMHCDSEVNGQQKLDGQLSIAEEVFSTTFAFNNLKHLELLTGYTKNDLLGIETLLGTCPRLEFLVLQYFSGRRDDFSMPLIHDNDVLGEEIMDMPAILHVPCLKLVRMKNYRGTKGELYVVELLKKSKIVLEKIVAFPAKEGSASPRPLVLWLSTLRSFEV